MPHSLWLSYEIAGWGRLAVETFNQGQGLNNKVQGDQVDKAKSPSNRWAFFWQKPMCRHIIFISIEFWYSHVSQYFVAKYKDVNWKIKYLFHCYDIRFKDTSSCRHTPISIYFITTQHTDIPYSIRLPHSVPIFCSPFVLPFFFIRHFLLSLLLLQIYSIRNHQALLIGFVLLI